MKKIKLLLLLVFTLLLPFNVFASTNTYDRNTLDNLGVNKKWTITDSNRGNVLKSKKVDASEKIYDFSDILTDEEEKKLLERINSFIKKYNTDFVFLSDDLSYTHDVQNERYAADFYDYNDFGLDLEKYSGILLFRNTYSTDPYYDMYLFGNSQLYFDNTRKDEILDSIYYNFHYGRYYAGLNLFLDYCERYYEEGVPYELEGYYVDDNGYLQKDPNFVRKKPPFKAPILPILIVDAVITLIVILILIKKNKMVKKGLKTLDYLDKQSVVYTKQNDQFINSFVTSHVRQTTTSSGGHSHSSGGSYHSSGGSSGGGHSSGGGRHG